MGNEVTIKFTATENISATMQKVILQTEAMIDAMRKLNGQVASASAGSTKSINDLTTATNKLEEATRKQAKTVESSGASWTTLASQYYLAKNAINAVVNALQTWGSVYVDVAKAGADFERTLDNIMAVQQETKENMQAIAAAALEAGRTTVYSANESAQAMLILAQAGFSAREQIEALPAVLNFAAAAGTTLERSAFVLSTTMRQFNMATTDATHIADVFSLALAESQLTATSLVEAMKYAGPAGAAFGQSLEETVALVSKFVDMGFEGSMAGTNFRMALSFLAKGTRDSADALKGLGMTMQSVNPMTHQISEIVATFGDALEKAGRSSMTAMEGIAIFGQRAGPAMAQVINTQMTLASESEKNLGNLVRRMQEVDEVARDMAKTMTDNVWGSVKKLQNVVNDLKLAFFSAFGDQLKKALDMVRDSILGNKHTIVEIAAESLEDFVAVARTLLVVTSPLIITLGSLYVGFKILIGAVLAVAESLASLAAGDLQGAKKAWTDYATGVARSAEANAMLAETIQSVIYETQGFTVNTELASKTIGMLSQTAQAEMPKFQKEFMVALEAASDSMVELRNTSKDIAKEIFGILASPEEQAKQDMEEQIADWEQQIVDARQRISDLWAKSEGEGGALIPGALENIEQMEAEVKAMESRIAEYRAAKTKEINDKAAEERSKETEAVKRDIEKQHKERIKKLKEWVDNMGKQAKDANARQIALDQKAFETRMMQYNREQDLVRRNMEERKYLMEQLVETGEMFISSLSQFGSASSAGGALSGAGGLIGSLLKGIGTGVRAAGGKGDVGDLGKLISSIGEYTSAVFGYVGMAAEFLTKLPDVVNKVIPEIIKNLPNIVKNGLAVLPKLLRDELPAIVRTVVEDVIPAMLKALPEIVAALIEGLVTAVGVLIENLPDIIGQAFEAGVKVLVNGILGAVSDLFGKLGENLGLGKGVGKAIGYMVNPTNAIGDIADGLGFGGGNAAKNRERRAEEAQQAYSAGVAGSTDAVLAVLSALGRFADKDLTNAVTNLKQIEGGIDGVLKKMWETDDLNDEMVAQLNLHTEELKAQIDVLKDYRDSLRQLKEAFREVRNNIRDIRDEIATQGVFGADPEKVLELERKRLGKTFASFAKEVANNAVTPESAAAVAESVKSWFMNAAQRIQDGLKAQLDILDKEVQNAYSRWEKIRKEAESKAEEDYKNAVESLKDQINDTFADTKAKAEAWRDGMLRSIDGVFTNLSDKLGGLKDLADNLARVQERRTDIGFKMSKTQRKLMGASDEEMTQFVNNQDLKNFMNTLFSAAGQAGMSQQGLAKYTTGTVGQVGGFDPFWEKFVAGQANQGPLSAETINELAESVNQLAEAGAIDYKQFDMLSQYILALSDKTEQTSKDMIEQQKTAFLDAFHNSGMSTGTFDIAEATRMSAEELRKLVEERVTAGDFAGAEDALARLRDEEKWLVQQEFEKQVADAQALRDADLLLAVNGTHPLLTDAIAKRDADIAQAKLDYDAAVARTDAWAAAFTSGLVAQANKELSATRAAANFVLGLVEGIVQTEMDRLTSAIEELTREIQIARGYVNVTQVDKTTEDELRRGFLQLPIGTGPIPDDQVVQLHRGERVMTQEQYRRTVNNAAMSGGSDPQVSAALQRIASLLESGQGGEAGPVIIELHMDTDLEKIVAKGIRKNAERNNLVVSGSTINVKQV